MIISFFGHSDAYLNDNERQSLLNILVNTLKSYDYITFYLGGYGSFDNTCLSCLLDLKRLYSNFKLCFITPYLRKSTKLDFASYTYDETIYPPIENTPLKYAISKRNKWIVENSDLVICYINHKCGGAYQGVCHAKRKNIPTINIGVLHL